MTEQEKLELLIQGRYLSLKNVADLISACPHVVPSGIGISQYLDELKKGARFLSECLIQEEDLKPFFSAASIEKKNS